MVKAKDIRYGIKTGLTEDDFCTKYGYDSTEDFLRDVRLIFPHTSDDIIAQIRHSGKKHRHARKTAVKRTTEQQVVSERKEEKPVSKLEELQATEEDLSKEIIELESQHKDLMQERRTCIAEIEQMQADLNRLDKERKELCQKHEAVVNRHNDLAERMNKLTRKRAEKLITLNSVRDEINSLKKTIVAVYNNGTFEIVEGKEISLETSGDEALKASFLTSEYEDLTVRQIVTVVNAICIYKDYPQVEFMFEDDRIEEIFAGKTRQVPA